jgi:hypothetical protein
MMRKTILAGAAALSLVAVFAASSVGDEGSSRTGALDRDYERVRAHRVDAPSASGSALAGASAKGKPKVRYFETDTLSVPVGGDSFAVECPRKHKALSGYFLSSGGITLDASAISETSPRIWEFGLFSPSGAAGSAIVGVVCGKKL